MNETHSKLGRWALPPQKFNFKVRNEDALSRNPRGQPRTSAERQFIPRRRFRLNEEEAAPTDGSQDEDEASAGVL